MAYSVIPKRSEKEWIAYKHWRTHPVDAVKDWFGVTPSDWQGDALTALFTGSDRVAIKSAHGVGKTAFDSWVGWIFLNCYEDSRVVATAPTQAQLQDALFSEFALWHSKMKKRMQDEWVISATHIRNKSNPNVWFAVARTSNKPANLQGFHNRYLQIIGDEASGIGETVFEVMEGALSEAEEEQDDRVARLVLNGNPNFVSGEMFNAFGRNKALYRRFTVTGDPELLSTLNIEQGEDHPEHGNVYYSSRVKPKYVANMKAKYGEDSAIFDVRVRGIFPRFSDDCIIPWADAWRATQFELPHFDTVADGVTLVVDPARGGMAETAIGWFRRGYCYRLEGHKTARTTQIVDLVHQAVLAITASGLKLVEIIVDEPGQGVGVVDELLKLNLPVTPYNGSLPMVRGQDPEDDIQLFFNRRARDWWNVRLLLEKGLLPLPNDEVMLAQGTSVRYKHNTQEKIVVESKQDMKDRLGKDASPDRFDVIVMGTARRYQPAAVAGLILPGDFLFGDARPQMDMDL
jgi:phage terminase large subunit